MANAANAALHPLAPHHLPAFITPPGETDVLMVVMAVVLLGSVLGFGIFYLFLHSLPERIAHTGKKIQFEIVAVLGLISLFTHMHIFWIIGLMLALIEVPDFSSMFGRIAGSVEKMAGFGPGEGLTLEPNQVLPDPHAAHDVHEAPQPAAKPPTPPDAGRPVDSPAPARKPEIVRAGQKEHGHA